MKFGLLAGLLVQAGLNADMHGIPEYLQYYTGVIGGAYAPDIDQMNSKIGKKLRPISTFIYKTFGHRGITHSLLFLVILAAVLLYELPPNFQYIGFGFLVGYVSHMLGDFITPMGIPLFWPIKTRYKFPLLKSEKRRHRKKRKKQTQWKKTRKGYVRVTKRARVG